MTEQTELTYTAERGLVTLDEFTNDDGTQCVRVTVQAKSIPPGKALTLAELDDLFFLMREYRRHRHAVHGKYYQRGNVCEVCGKPVNDRAERCYDHRFVPEYWWQEGAKQEVDR